ncbi:multidrug transporter subunit MdtN [Martelella alba]|uniref:Multidrug transporter subunit MdtN n=1 Tax=Martelella alba TaxID=2590451 RepID=A0A506UJ56_9HYPH|nr:multidrug transporter subunit MdtN [Martelella alba]TPW33364.1 multidrug transporter subunit MdtN [Martelella alba]
MLSLKAKALALVPVALIAGTIWLGYSHMTRMRSNILSQDATLTADITNISASVPGRVSEIFVAENDRVTKGQLLLTLDDTVYRLQVTQAEGDLKAAEAAYETQQRNIAAEQANAAVAEQQIERARVNLDLATKTLDRLLPLQPKGYVTDQQVQDARTAKLDAEVSLQQALQQSTAANALVSSPEASLALIQSRQAALDIAKRNLANTRVYAPHNGRVVGLIFSAGQYIVTGQSVFTLVNTDKWYATALYREGELNDIRVGTCATVYVMADKSVPVKGHVQGIGWGVASEGAINIPRSLPYVPKELDWVRIAQRFPVRIALDNPPEHLMRIGASASSVVNYGTNCGDQ